MRIAALYDIHGNLWTLIGPRIEPRRTAYDLARAAEAIRASGFPAADEFVEKYLLSPPAPAEVASWFERMAVDRAGPSR